MNDPMEFLRRIAEFYNTTPTHEQERFVHGVQQGLEEGKVFLIEADGGIGKTLGYLVCGMREAERKGLPLIIATSTITNRDQIRHEYDKIVQFAERNGDPIADMPYIEYHSIRDYPNLDRVKELIRRLEHTSGPKLALAELYEIRDRLQQDGELLLDGVMPYDITSGEIEDADVIVQRREIAASERDKNVPQSYVSARQKFKDNEDRACVVVMTQAMLALSRPIRKQIQNGNVAAVVIDEADKLTTIDYPTYTSVVVETIREVLTSTADADIDVSAATTLFEQLQEVISDIKASVPDGKKQVMLIYAQISEQRIKNLYQVISDLSLCLDALAGAVAETPDTNWQEDISQRRLLYKLEELADSISRLREFILPHGHREYVANATDIEVFFSWYEGDEFRVVAARPGGILRWLFRDRTTVPVLLTTAYLGEPENWYAAKISLPLVRLTRSDEIRAQRFGTLKFIYMNGLHDAIHDNPKTGIKEPNPAHFDDIEQIVRFSPWAWEPGKRLLILTPGYHDIREIETRLMSRGSNAPIFAQRRGSNINTLRDKLIQSKEGGILLTVYWEGFNIVDASSVNGRRGLIDVLVMSRIPFQRPNPMLETLYAHLGRSKMWVYQDVHIEAKRRIHQGFNRVIRGPMDSGSVVIADNRFPPPTVLTDQCDEISAKPAYVGMLDAIPNRFRFDEQCFELVDMESFRGES